jgi:hypothetical protein
MSRNRARLKNLSVNRLETHCVTSFFSWGICIKESSAGIISNAVAIPGLNFGRFLLKIAKYFPVFFFFTKFNCVAETKQ